MGFLSRIIHGRQRDIGYGTHAEAQVPDPTLQLPAATPRYDLSLWSHQMAEAKTMWAELHRDTANAAASAREQRLAGGPKMAVVPHTLLAPVRGRHEKVPRQLHANHVGPGVVVMAMPRADEAGAWRSQSAAHGVTHVVRIGTTKETQCMGMDGFDPVSGGPLRSALKQADRTDAPRTWDVAVSPESAICPREMLRLFNKLASHPPEPGRIVAFQSPDGDDRSAVFAAGWQLYQAFMRAENAKQAGDEKATFGMEDVAQVVQASCMALRCNRSSSQIGHPEHIASLLTLGKLLMSRGPQQQQRVQFHYVGKLRPYVVGARMKELPQHSSQIDRWAMARHSRIGKRAAAVMAWRAAGEPPELYTPIPGGVGHYRVKQEAMLAPDPRLQAIKAAPLQGAWAAPETLILERMGPSQNLAWAQACLRHNITAVVDLSTNAERRQSPDAMGKGVHHHGADTHCRFDWRPGPEHLLGADRANAHVRGMIVSATIAGAAEKRDMSDEPVFDRRARDTERILEFIRVPLEPRRAIPPSKLLAIARMISDHRGSSTREVVALQCPQVDARAAVVAAADAIHTRFQAGKLGPKDLVNAARAEWARLVRDYSPGLANHPSHLTSLLGMTELMLVENKGTMRW
ncbi:hypothetical protein SAMN05216359_101552 [Roseateles sp. YR242]|nr:hypothetical protein SAMN05216359_101552 [Roseateles sp. YR242]